MGRRSERATSDLSKRSRRCRYTEKGSLGYSCGQKNGRNRASEHVFFRRQSRTGSRQQERTRGVMSHPSPRVQHAVQAKSGIHKPRTNYIHESQINTPLEQQGWGHCREADRIPGLTQAPAPQPP